MAAPTAPIELPQDRVLIISRLLDAPRPLVFSVWTRPEHVTRWWGPKDFTLPSCDMQFEQGGRYRFCMRSPEGTDYWVWGAYREIVEPERIVFTWEREDAQGNPINHTVVTVTLEEIDPRRTRLTLHQAVFDTTKDRDEHNGGWTECLERLAAYATSLAGSSGS